KHNKTGDNHSQSVQVHNRRDTASADNQGRADAYNSSVLVRRLPQVFRCLRVDRQAANHNLRGQVYKHCARYSSFLDLAGDLAPTIRGLALRQRHLRIDWYNCQSKPPSAREVHRHSRLLANCYFGIARASDFGWSRSPIKSVKLRLLARWSAQIYP